MPKKPEPAPPPGPSPFARGPTGLSGGVTAVLGLMLLAGLFWTSLHVPANDRSIAFERAPESVARVFERRLELAAAMRELPSWESAALAPFVPASERTADEAAAAFRSVVETRTRALDPPAKPDGEKPVDAAPVEELTPEEKARIELQLDGLRARRAVLLTGFGRLEEAQGDLDELARNGHAEFVAAVRALSSGRASAEDLALAGDEWIGRVAVASARGESPPRPGESARRTLTWARGIACTTAFGLLILLGWLARNRPDVVAGSIVVPSIWSPQTGFGVLVRAAFLALLVAAAFAALQAKLGTDVPAYFGAAIACVPLVWMSQRHLARPHRASLLDLAGWPATMSTALPAALALFAVQQIGSRALANAALASGAVDPWSFQIDEFLLWSRDGTLLLSAIDSVLFGWIAIEFAFRGILFPSLRHVHGPLHAAALTGLLYSVTQFESLPTMLALAWSGFVLSLSVERTRTLVPAILCVVFGGVLENGLLVALYR